MVETMLIDLKALLVEREDCDAGTVQRLRDGLAQGKTQYRSLRDVNDVLKKKLETLSGPAAKKLNLKIGIVNFFLGHLGEAIDNLKQAEGALAAFYLGKSYLERQDLEEGFKAFDRAEKAGYTASQVQLQKAGIHRLRGEVKEAKALLQKLEDQASHNAEFHFQTASLHLGEGHRELGLKHLERAIELDPSHTGALFQLGHANDLAGNDEDAIQFYERCLNHPPLHVGLLINLGILYEDSEKYEKAVDCYRKVVNADPNHEQARLFLKDAQASVTMYYNPDAELASSRFSQVLEVPVTDFELSVRSRNCLKKMNIRTLGDLTRISEQQLLASKNFGETSLLEIKEILGVKGLRLGQALEDGGGGGGGGYDRRFSAAPAMSEQEQAVLNRPVNELNLSVRARKCMNRLGINTIGELVMRSADELLESKNFGMTSLYEVREKLKIINVSLRGD
ncbi:MAG: DNA-directed RNA polymerase subunit alpha C-terminal domain-containing protein [Planctomycetota bacterium]